MVKTRLTRSAENNALVENNAFTCPPENAEGQKKLRGYEARARALEASAAILSAEADQMRRDAALMRQRESDHKRRQERRDIWKRVSRLMDAGAPEARAVAAVAATMGASQEHVAYWVAWAEKNRSGFRRWRRDREIMRLAALGFTNKEITRHPAVVRLAGRQLHEKTITVIIGRALGRQRT